LVAFAAVKPLLEYAGKAYAGYRIDVRTGQALDIVNNRFGQVISMFDQRLLRGIDAADRRVGELIDSVNQSVRGSFKLIEFACVVALLTAISFLVYDRPNNYFDVEMFINVCSHFSTFILTMNAMHFIGTWGQPLDRPMFLLFAVTSYALKYFLEAKYYFSYNWSEIRLDFIKSNFSLASLYEHKLECAFFAFVLVHLFRDGLSHVTKKNDAYAFKELHRMKFSVWRQLLLTSYLAVAVKLAATLSFFEYDKCALLLVSIFYCFFFLALIAYNFGRTGFENLIVNLRVIMCFFVYVLFIWRLLFDLLAYFLSYFIPLSTIMSHTYNMSVIINVVVFAFDSLIIIFHILKRMDDKRPGFKLNVRNVFFCHSQTLAVFILYIISIDSPGENEKNGKMKEQIKKKWTNKEKTWKKIFRRVIWILVIVYFHLASLKALLL